MSTESTELKVAESTGIYSAEQVAGSRLDDTKELPALTNARKHFVPLNVEYWSPAEAGDEKLVYIHSVGTHEVPDLETGELKPLLCVMMLENTGDKVQRIINASRVLVGNISDAIHRGEIVPNTTLTPVSITFLGAVRNTSNAFSSNRWQIIPLIIETVEG